jgi:hypothetical protein
MQALVEARVSDDAESLKYAKPSVVLWRTAVYYIAENEGCSHKAAFFLLSDAISLGEIEAVNGYNEPLSPRLFPDRLVANFNHIANLSNSRSFAWQSPDLETYVRLNTLQKFCQPKPGINPAAAFPVEAPPPPPENLQPRVVTRSVAENFAKEYIRKTKAEGQQPTQVGIAEAARQAGIKGGRQLLRQALVNKVGLSAQSRGRPRKNNSPK